MQRRWWSWLIYAIGGYYFVLTIFRAFAEPWHWTLYQILFVYFVLCLAAVVGLWTFVWLRGGTAAVRERWALRKQVQVGSFSPRAFGLGILIWTVVALVIVFVFNIIQR